MDKESIIKSFISCREKLREVAINIKDLPPDDDWIQDGEWDKIYEETVKNNERKV
jgi:hypothetical protein